jgi:two-component system response regulator (stage 0 sporulation protein A)
MNKKQVFEILNKVGISCDLKGRDYIETAIELVYENNNISVVNELYPKIAEKYDTTPSRVERSIRHAVENVFDNSNDCLTEIFGNTISIASGKLANTKFIFGLVKYLKVMCEE